MVPLFLQPRRANVRENTTIPGKSTHTEEKCPEKHHKTGRKYNHGKEMSRKSPQNQEKVHPQKGNVLKNTTKPGKIATTERKKRITHKGYPLYQNESEMIICPLKECC